MTVDQMLWHVNAAMALSIGETTASTSRMALPPVVLKFIVLRLPWPKGSPTHPDFVARSSYDFEGERARLRRLLEALATRPLNGTWPQHPILGRMNGREVSRLTAKHLDHHLRQFGV